MAVPVLQDDQILSVHSDLNLLADKKRLEHVERALAAGNAGMWSADFTTGTFSYSRSVTNRLTKAEVEKIQKQGLWAIIHRDDLAHVTKTWQAVLNGSHPFDFVHRVVTEQDGIMWQRSIGVLERNEDGKLIGGTALVTDITKDIENKRALTRAREASKAKSEFLARMSHEIRTPLNAIIGLSDSLKDEALSPEIMDVVSLIEESAEGLHHLLSRTLDHAKLISDKMEVQLESRDIRDIVARCTKLWKPQAAAKGLKMGIHLSDNLPQQILLDSFRLQQCLNNLLSNAIKFTETGSVHLIVKLAQVDGQDRLVIAVKDSGIGMTAKQAQAIFDPFTQADGNISRKYGGSGLGMSITKQLTELMGGRIRVKSDPGQGSTFAMILPILEQADDLKDFTKSSQQTDKIDSQMTITRNEKTISDKSDLTPKKPFEGLSVLCVEDNVVNQKVVNRLIGKRVDNLYFADNGREALDVLNDTHIDVVLMDIHMPVMDGIEATLEIRGSGKAYANVIIIALTADPDYQQRRICKNIGMDDTIAKPVKRADIMKAFDRALGSINRDFATQIEISA